MPTISMEVMIEDQGGTVCENANEMKLEVDCYAGRKADERSVRFRLDGHEYMVDGMPRPVLL